MKLNVLPKLSAFAFTACMAMPATATVCALDDIQFNAFAGVTNATSCATFLGNDSTSLFSPDYTLVGKTDEESPVTGNVALLGGGSIFLSLTATPEEAPSGDLLLQWTGGPALMNFVFVVKAANEYITYKFDNYLLSPANSSDDGTYEVAITNNKGKAQDLSHMSFWANGTKTNEVPEPASLALLGLGLLGVVASRRVSKGTKA